MCLNLSYENKIHLNRIKSKMSRVLDKMNDTLVYAVEEFDKKYTEFGGIILKKFNTMWNSQNTRRYRYSRANSGYVSPASPFEIISEDNSEQTQIHSYDTHNTVIDVEEDVSSKSNTQFQESKQKIHQSREMVEKHFIDNTESFLDDAWDIINGND